MHEEFEGWAGDEGAYGVVDDEGVCAVFPSAGDVLL